MTRTEDRIGCPCGCQSSKWADDPKCIRHTTPAERYRQVVARRKAS